MSALLGINLTNGKASGDHKAETEEGQAHTVAEGPHRPILCIRCRGEFRTQ